MKHELRLGRLFGIEFGLHTAWFLLFPLMVGFFAFGVFPIVTTNTLLNLTLGFDVALLFFFSVLFHELAHVLCAILCGRSVLKTCLLPFEGVSVFRHAPKSKRNELFVAAAGPFSSLLLGIILLFLAGQTVELGTVFSRSVLYGQDPLEAVLILLGQLNIALGLFHLIPAFPLDGGRVLRVILWHLTGRLMLSTRIAVLIGEGYGFLLMLIAVLVLFGIPMPLLNIGFWGGFWVGLIGWMIVNSSKKSSQMIEAERLLALVRVVNGVSLRPAKGRMSRLLPKLQTLMFHLSLRKKLNNKPGQEMTSM